MHLTSSDNDWLPTSRSMASMIMSDKFIEPNKTIANFNEVQARSHVTNNHLLSAVINDVDLAKRNEMRKQMSFDFSQPQPMRQRLLKYNFSQLGDLPTPQSPSTLMTPEFVKLSTPEMEEYIAKGQMTVTPVQPSPLASYKLFESLSDLSPGLFSPSPFLANQSMATQTTKSAPASNDSSQAKDKQATGQSALVQRSASADSNSEQSLVIDDKSNDRASNSDESRSSNTDDQDKTANDFSAVQLGAVKTESDQSKATHSDTNSSPQPSVESQSNSPASVGKTSSGSLPSANTSMNGPFISGYNAHQLQPMAPYCQPPIINQPSNNLAASMNFPSSGGYPLPLPTNPHNLLTNPPRLPTNYPTHPTPMTHLANPSAPYPAIPPNYAMNPHAGYAINSQVANHFYNNRLAIINGSPVQTSNSAPSKPRATKQAGGSSTGSSSSEESVKRVKKEEPPTDDAEEKKRRRNREAAERCRKRKLERFNNLEEQCNQYRERLTEANLTIMRLSQKCQQLEQQLNQYLGLEGRMAEKAINGV